MEEMALHIATWTGFALLVVALIVSNKAFLELTRAVNKAHHARYSYAPLDRPSMKTVIQRVRLYKAAYGDGPAWKHLKYSYWIAGIGMALIVGSSFWLQKF